MARAMMQMWKIQTASLGLWLGVLLVLMNRRVTAQVIHHLMRMIDVEAQIFMLTC